jgi:hypothetical protein
MKLNVGDRVRIINCGYTDKECFTKHIYTVDTIEYIRNDYAIFLKKTPFKWSTNDLELVASRHKPKW